MKHKATNGVWGCLEHDRPETEHPAPPASLLQAVWVSNCVKILEIGTSSIPLAMALAFVECPILPSQL